MQGVWINLGSLWQHIKRGEDLARVSAVSAHIKLAGLVEVQTWLWDHGQVDGLILHDIAGARNTSEVLSAEMGQCTYFLMSLNSSSS